MTEIKEISPFINECLNKIKVDDYEDANDRVETVKEIIEQVIDGALKLKEMENRVNMSEPNSKVEEARIRSQQAISIAEVEADNKIKLKELETEAQVKIAKARNRWAIHLIWLVSVIVGTYLFLPFALLFINRL